MSILRSTRQNKWLSTPHNQKKVSFQLQSNNNLNKQQESTMAKTKDKSSDRSSDKKKKVEKSSGIQPFLFTAEEWPKDAPEQIIETTEGRNRLRSKMKILSGTETPEQLMMYLKNFEDKIYKNIKLTAPEKFAILKRIVDKEAQTIVSEVESD